MFAGVDLHAVVVVHAVVVGVHGGFVVGRGGGGVGRGVAVAGCVVGDSESSDSGGKNNEDLKSNSDKVVALLLTKNWSRNKLILAVYLYCKAQKPFFSTRYLAHGTNDLKDV